MQYVISDLRVPLKAELRQISLLKLLLKKLVVILGIILQHVSLLLLPTDFLAGLQGLQLFFGIGRVLIVPLKVNAQPSLDLLLLVLLARPLTDLFRARVPRLVHFLLQLIQIHFEIAPVWSSDLINPINLIIEWFLNEL